VLYVELATRGGKDRVRPGGGRRFTLVVGELNQSLVSEGEREGEREGGERRDVAWGVVDGNDVASVVKREGGRGRGGEGRRREGRDGTHRCFRSNDRDDGQCFYRYCG